MMPKLINWLGVAIFLGLLILINAVALHDIIVGETDVRAEVITLIVSAGIILIAVALKLTVARKR